MNASAPLDPAPTVATWLAGARARLAGVSDEAPLEAELLVRHVTGRSRATLVAWPEAPLDEATTEALAALLRRRLRGEPLAYLTGTREFWSLELEVGPAVLVPRGDTETLVERTLRHVAEAAAGILIEAGTGSGAIAAALATECDRHIVATDIDAAALVVARRNVHRHPGPGRVSFVRGDWLAPFADASAALVLSNPPYLADDDPHLRALAGEPRGALVAGAEGLDALARLVTEACRVARPGAAVLLEHGASQGAAVRALFTRHGYVDIATTRDLAGHERVSEARRPAA